LNTGHVYFAQMWLNEIKAPTSKWNRDAWFWQGAFFAAGACAYQIAYWTLARKYTLTAHDMAYVFDGIAPPRIWI
jgi:hypothetical protein